MIDINEQDTLVKQSDIKTTELLLVDKVKELERTIIEIEQKHTLLYGYNIYSTTLIINMYESKYDSMSRNRKAYIVSYKLNDTYIELSYLRNIEIIKQLKKFNII